LAALANQASTLHPSHKAIAMNHEIGVIVLLGAIATVLSIMVASTTLGRTIVAVTNSMNANTHQLNAAINALSNQVQLHVTEAAGKFELLDYQVHGLEEALKHKAQRFEKEFDRLKQIEGWASKNYNYKIRVRDDSELQ
jgi:hypothetical protein